MAKKKISVEFSQRGIEQLKKELLDYKDTLQYKVDLLAKTLAETGVDVARANVARLDAIFTGELIASIHTEFGGSGNGTAIFYIVADSEHAAYVEFGTGQLGMEGGYPYPFPPGVDWQYNTGKTIFEVSPGQYGWFYKADNGEWYFTQGMPSRPFMYETSLDLMRLVVKIAKGVFK